MIKSILALSQGGPDSDMAFRLAASVARAFGASVDALHFPPEDSGGGLALASQTMAMPEMAQLGAQDERTQRSSRAFAEHLAPIAGASFMPAERDLDILVRKGRTADLLVIGSPGSDPDNSEPYIVEPSLYECACPVLIAPQGPASIALDSAIVAWNGSAQAARAVLFALPFLKRTRSVTLLVGSGDQAAVGAPDLMRHLGRHGITVRIDAIDPGAVSARSRGRALLEYTHASKAGFLVMGAYGRGEIERFLGLGGATGKVISACRVPLLMAA